MYEKHAQLIESALKQAEDKKGLQALSERFFECFFEVKFLFIHFLVQFHVDHVEA